MEAFNRLFIVGLLVIQLVGVYAENRVGLSAQQPRESALTIENAAAQPVAEGTPRILKKRSNRHTYPRTWTDRPIHETMMTEVEYKPVQHTQETQQIQATQQTKATRQTQVTSRLERRREADRNRQRRFRERKRQEILSNSRASDSGASRTKVQHPVATN